MNGDDRGRMVTQVGMGTPGGAYHGYSQAPGPSKGILSWIRQFFGSWAGPTASKDTPAAYHLERERVRGNPPGLVIPQFLPYFDDQTGETPVMRLAYRKMLSDPNVKSALLGKILAVAALDLSIQPANKRNAFDKNVADFVLWNLTRRLRGVMVELVWSVLSGALIDGFSVVEKVIENEKRGKWAGKFVLSKLKPKDVYYDLVLEADEFRNTVGVMGLRYNAGEHFHPSNFLIYSHLPLYSSPTGMSDLRAVYSRYWLLDTALKLRAVGLEKRAVPVLHGQYPASMTTVKNSLKAALANAQSKNWLATPLEAKVEALNIAGTSDDIFAGAIRDLKHDIFLGIQGAILQALEGSITDGRGASSVHSSTADLLKWHLSAAVSAMLNDHETGLIRDLVDLNFVVSEYPAANLSAIDLSVLLQELQIDNGLKQMGLPLSQDELYERYNRKPPEMPGDELAPAPPDSGAPGGPGHPGGAIGTDGPAPLPELPDPSKGPGSDRRGDGSGRQDRGSPFAEFADDWDESKHPRGDDGKFGKGSGSGKSKKAGKQSRNERQRAKKAKREERRQPKPPPRVERRPTESSEDVVAVQAGLLDQLSTVAPAKAKEFATKLLGQAYDALPKPMQQLCSAVAAVEHAMASVPSDLAAEAARQRGLSEEQAQAVKIAARGADLAAGWTFNVPMAHGALEQLGVTDAVGEVGTLLAAKVGYYLPVGSLAYLAYSTAKNTLATIKAAKALIEKAKATKHAEDDYGHEHGSDGRFVPKGHGGEASGDGAPSSGGDRRKAYESAVADWKAKVAEVAERNKQAKAAWESRVDARVDRRQAAEDLGDARLIADDGPLSAADPEEDATLRGAEKTEEGRQAYAERAAKYVAMASSAFDYDVTKLAQIGASDKAIGKLQKALERGKSAVLKAAEKYQKGIEKSNALYAKLQEMDASDPAWSEPEYPEGDIPEDQIDAVNEEFEKAHDAWQKQSDAFDAKKDALDEKADATDEAKDAAHDALREAFEEHRAKVDDLIDEITSGIMDDIDAEDEADPEPEEEEFPDEPEEPEEDEDEDPEDDEEGEDDADE